MKKLALLFIATGIAGTAIAQHNVSTNGTRNTIVFESTGAWCQHCGDGAVYLKNTLDAQPKAIGVAVHDRDGMSIRQGDSLNAAFIGGFPQGFIDMHKFGSTTAVNRGSWKTNADQRVNMNADFDVALSYVYDQSSREITANVTVTALKDMTGNFNANIALTENDVVGPNNNNYSQTSATRYDTLKSHPHYGLGLKIHGFSHQHVLRAFFASSIFGQELFEDPKNGESQTITFKYTIPAQYDVLAPKLNNMHLVAYVQERGANPTSVIKDRDDVSVHNAVEAYFLAWNPNSVNTVNQLNEIAIVPNPASSFINVKAYLTNAADANITISNIAGQVVYSKDYTTNNNLLSENINVDGYQNGIYIIRVSSNGEQMVKRFSIAK